MPDFNLDNIRALTAVTSKAFAALQKAPKKDYEDIATVNVTKSHTVNYAWLNDTPSMSEWVGNRDTKTLTEQQYHIVKKDWEASIKVMRDDFLFDNLGIVKPKIEQLHHAILKHYNSMVNKLITDNGICFDGQPFFGQHTVGDTTYTNKGTRLLTEENLFAVIANMQAIKNLEGEALGVEPTMLLVAPNLFRAARTILGAKTIAGTDNIAHNLLKLKVVQTMPENSWCVLDTGQPLKPFILQITKVSKLEEDTSKMFTDKYMTYGVDTMDNAGYGFWQLAYFSDGSATA